MMIKEIPELTFFGYGGSFNVNMHGTSAYMIIDTNSQSKVMNIGMTKNLILFDCTENACSEIISDTSIIDNIHNVIICLTHFHPDHIDGLGKLLYYIKHGINRYINVKFLIPPYSSRNYLQENYLKRLDNYLESQYINKNDFNICYNETVEFNIDDCVIQLDLKQNTSHNVDDAYYIYLVYKYNKTNDNQNNYRYIIYTGDTSKFPPPYIENDWDKCESIYIDCNFESKIDDSIHYSLEEIIKSCDDMSLDYEKIIPVHFGSDDVAIEAWKKFKYPKTIKR